MGPILQGCNIVEYLLPLIYIRLDAVTEPSSAAAAAAGEQRHLGCMLAVIITGFVYHLPQPLTRQEGSIGLR